MNLGLNIPKNPEAERLVLGAALLTPEAFAQAAAELRRDDFLSDAHKAIFDALVRLRESGAAADPVTLRAELERAGDFERAGGMVGISEILDGAPRYTNVSEYVRLVKDASFCRTAMHFGQWLVNVASAGDYKADDLGAEILKKAEDLQARQFVDDLVPSSVAVERALKKLEEQWQKPQGLSGHATGFYDLDRILHGLRGGKMYLIAASTGLGKTTLALNFVHAVIDRADEGAKPVVLFVTLEMTAEELTERALSTVTGIDSDRIQSGDLTAEERAALYDAGEFLKQMPVEYIEGYGGLTARNLTARVERVRRKYGRIDMIVVDYLQLLDGDDNAENETVRLSRISRALKGFTLKYKIPVLALSQLNRQWAQRQSKEPDLPDLRGSGSIEQDSDVVMFIARVDYEDEENPRRWLLIKKHRGGKTGRVPLLFQGEHSRFVNCEADESFNTGRKRGPSKREMLKAELADINFDGGF